MAKIIQIVGTSGSGKSTVEEKLREKLTVDGYIVETIIEPGPLNTLAKSYRLRPDKNPWMETALFSVDRFMTYTERVLPRMHEKNLIFLSVRGIYDTIVYQGLRGGIDIEMIKKMNDAILFPDLTLALVVEGSIGFERALERKKETGEELSSNETPEKIDLLGSAYKRLPELFPNQCINIIDTSYLTKEQTVTICYDQIWSLLSSRPANEKQKIISIAVL